MDALQVFLQGPIYSLYFQLYCIHVNPDNIHKVMQRGEQLDTLQNKTGDFIDSYLQFQLLW